MADFMDEAKALEDATKAGLTDGDGPDDVAPVDELAEDGGEHGDS